MLSHVSMFLLTYFFVSIHSAVSYTFLLIFWLMFLLLSDSWSAIEISWTCCSLPSRLISAPQRPWHRHPSPRWNPRRSWKQSVSRAAGSGDLARNSNHPGYRDFVLNRENVSRLPEDGVFTKSTASKPALASWTSLLPSWRARDHHFRSRAP